MPVRCETDTVHNIIHLVLFFKIYIYYLKYFNVKRSSVNVFSDVDNVNGLFCNVSCLYFNSSSSRLTPALS